jgi:hypothetical protein
MAEILPGDFGVGRDGRPTRVRSINDCGVHDVFRLTFSDGTNVECSPNHLWTVEKVWGRRETLTLRAHEIAADFVYQSPGGQIHYRYRVPVCAPVEFGRAEKLALDPYLVGALLGNGSLASGTARFGGAEPEIVEAFRNLLPVGVVVGKSHRYSYNIVDPDCRGKRQGSRARTVLVNAGIWGNRSPDKFIPDVYKFAAPEHRLSVLQGLLDTDGSATGGAASFCTTSRRLADDVRFLAQSLGGSATLNVKPDRRGYRDSYAVHVALPPGMRPFRLSRKLEKMKVRRHPADRTIVAMEVVDRRPVKCISVEAEDGLYLTDNFVVTHNSAFIQHQHLIEASLSQTTNCRVDLSTPNGLGNLFEQNRHSGRIPVFTFHWADDPRKSEAWYEKQKRDLSPVVVAQEIDIDYTASVERIIVPHSWVLSAIDAHAKLGVALTGARVAALDVADEGMDTNAVCGGYGVLVDTLEEWSGQGDNIFGSTERAFWICDEHDYQTLLYDADGLGAAVRGDGSVINQRRRLQGQREISVLPFRGSAQPVRPESQDVAGRKNKDFFLNLKAQGWWSLRQRFERTHLWVTQGIACKPEDIISLSSGLSNVMKLANELSQPTYWINGVGKLQVDKMPDGAKSPNLADAVMMRYAPRTSAVIVTDAALATMSRRA